MTISSAGTTDSSLASLLGDNADPLAASVAKADRRFAEMLGKTKEAKDTLAEITEGGAKGYWSWKIKEMKKQIAGKVMQEMNLTPEKIAAMSAKERLETENKIMQIVEQRLRLALEEEQKRQQTKNAKNDVNGNVLVTSTQDPLRAQLTTQVLQENNLTAADLDKLAPTQRMAAKDKIDLIVDQRMSQAANDAAKRRQQDTFAASVSLQTLIATTQDVGFL